MSITHLVGDLFEIVDDFLADENDSICIPHVCNNCGSWGAGFVMSISSHWLLPEVIYRKNSKKLGTVTFASVTNRVTVCNMVAQTMEPTKRRLHYGHLARCMDKLDFRMRAFDGAVRIVCPKFGAGLSGGDWTIVEELIEGMWGNYDVYVVTYKPANKNQVHG